MLFGSTEIELLRPTGEPTEAAKHRFEATHRHNEARKGHAPQAPGLRGDAIFLRDAIWARVGRFARIA